MRSREMTNNIAPPVLTIAGLREQYLNHQVTPDEVIGEIIQRAKADAGLNIWITPPVMEKIQPYLDRLTGVDPESLPLWGIPFAIKDNIDLAGVPTTAGCPEYAYLPDRDAEVVARLLAAGAIPVGKTNLDQFATGLVGTRSPYGETGNALRPELISGGSSSGSAVAVARGQAAFSLGTDTAGSGRVPAALNNLVGYKPSLGAWPTTGVVPACASLDCVTVFAHSLADTQAVDAVVRGVDPADPWSRSLRLPSTKPPAKICLPKAAPEFFGPFAADYWAAWEAAAAQCRQLNIPVEYIDCSLFAQAAALLYEGPFVAERWADLGGFINAHPGAAFPVTEQVLRTADSPDFTAAAYFTAQHKLQSFKAAARRVLADAVLVMPTAGGTWTRDQVRLDPIVSNSAMGRFTNHCNLLDLCAVAAPAGEAAPGTPFGITMFALAENEGLLVGAAKLFLERPAAERVTVSGQTNSGPTISGPTISGQTASGQTAADRTASGQTASGPTASGPTASGPTASGQTASGQTTLVAVCGLHMRGYSLEEQMYEHCAQFVREAVTAAKYQLVKLPTVPAKPGLIKRQEGGAKIQLEIWKMPLATFGAFAASIPAPLGIGKIELQDGTEVSGFICEAYAAEDAEDITTQKGWRNL